MIFCPYIPITNIDDLTKFVKYRVYFPTHWRTVDSMVEYLIYRYVTLDKSRKRKPTDIRIIEITNEYSRFLQTFDASKGDQLWWVENGIHHDARALIIVHDHNNIQSIIQWLEPKCLRSIYD